MPLPVTMNWKRSFGFAGLHAHLAAPVMHGGAAWPPFEPNFKLERGDTYAA